MITSLYVLCVSCALGSIILTAFGFTLNRPRFQDKPDLRLVCILTRIKDATATSLTTFLDLAIFFSMTLQFAGLLWLLQTEAFFASHQGNGSPCANRSCHFNSDDTLAGASALGGHLYNSLMLLYMSIITMCPLVTLLNTPYFWQNIRRHEFRLLAMALILILGGAVNIYWIGSYMEFYLLERKDHGTFPDAISNPKQGCLAPFLFEILPPPLEMKILRSSWGVCTFTLLLCLVLRWGNLCTGWIKGWYLPVVLSRTKCC